MSIRRLFAAVLLPGPVAPAAAQPAASDTTTPAVSSASAPRLTLADWALNRRRLLLDRLHNLGSGHFDREVHYGRGVFRHLTPAMDREYALDMLSYRFPPAATHRWHQADRGLRVRIGSTERSTWAFVTDLKETVSFGGPHRFTIDARLQEDGRARRTFLELGYRYAFTPRHEVGVQHTFSRYKPDLDVTAFYRADGLRWGSARVDLTLDNAYNNFVYSTLGVSAREEDILRIYNTPPVVARAQLTTPARYPVRVELHAGWRPEVTADFMSQTDPGFRYQDGEAAHYASALATYSWRTATVGLFYQRDQSSLTRQGGGNVRSSYRSEQRLSRYGVVAAGTWRDWQANLWYAIERYADRQTGTNFSLSTVNGLLDYWEDRHTAQIRLRYAPGRGVQAGLKCTAYVRDLDPPESRYLTRQWTGQYFSAGPSNYRLTPLLGYQWSRGSVIVGIGYDLDNDDLPPGIPDSPGRFDNGYGRLTVYW